MFRIENKKHGISMVTVWYAECLLKQKGIICYREASIEGSRNAERFDTLLTDLTETEEEIMERISKNDRYKIRRAAKENVQAKMITGMDVTQETIDDFCDFFVEFWKSKGVAYKDRDLLAEEIQQYAKEGAFALSIACINDKPCVYHTYLVDDQVARLYHSASLYRVNEEIPHNLVGMANRYLHKEDMICFKNMGKTIYDWGGAGKTEDVKSITEFKEAFGGKPAVFYDFTAVNGIKAKTVTMLSNLKSRFRK